MESIEFEIKDDRYILSIDKNITEENTIRNIIKTLRFQELSKKSGLNEEEMQLMGEDIKSIWWQKNSTEILKRINAYQKENTNVT